MIFASRLRILTAHCLREYRKLRESRVRVLSIRYIPTASTRPKHWCYIQTVTVQAAFRDAPADSIRVRVLRFGHTCAHSLYPHLQLWIFVLIPAHAHLLCHCHTVCSFLPLFQASTSHRRFSFFPFFVLPSIYPLARVWLIGLAGGSFQTSQQPSLLHFSFSPYCYYTLCVLYSIIPSFHSYCFFFLLSTPFSFFISFFLSFFHVFCQDGYSESIKVSENFELLEQNSWGNGRISDARNALSTLQIIKETEDFLTVSNIEFTELNVNYSGRKLELPNTIRSGYA